MNERRQCNAFEIFFDFYYFAVHFGLHNVLPLYVTPGSNEIDIKTFAGMKVSDGVMSFNFAGNAETKAGDLNAMFSALEIISSTTPAVQPGGKLTSTLATIKAGK